MDNPRGTNEVEAVIKTFRMIELLEELDGAGVTELANQLGWPKSTIHNHLATLKHQKLIIQEDNEYKLSLRFLAFGEYVKNKHPYTLVQTRVTSLADQLGERVHFDVEEHGDIVAACVATGEDAVKTGGGLGRRRQYPHATAAGKAILAFKPEEYVQEMIENNGLPRVTANTITDEEELFNQLAEVRERQYALNNEEHVEGVRAVATPVLDDNQDVVGALSVGGPANRIKKQRIRDEIADQLLVVKNELELEITHV